MKKHRAFSILGNIAIVNFPEEYSLKDKKEFAKNILEKNKSVRTVLEKTGKFSGELRIQKTKYVFGEKTKEILYKENNCEFRFNIDETYFSSRLSNERKEVCSFVKAKDEVLCMFAGVSPFPIVIAKNVKVKKIYSNELNKKANEYALENIKRNKVSELVELVPGDIKQVSENFVKQGKKFDLILMTRPNLEESFLSSAFPLCKNGSRVYYHAFCPVEEEEKQVEMISLEASKFGFKIKILNTKEIGDLGPGKVRYRIYFEVKKKGFFSRIFNL